MRHLPKRSRLRLKKTACLVVAVAMLWVIGLVLFNGCIAQSLRAEQRGLASAEVQQRLAEVRHAGKGSAVLLIHGFGGSPWDFKPLIDSLKDAGQALHAFVLPGHATAPADMKDTTADDWLKASFAAYDALEKQYENVAVVGFSMGGAIALHIAADRNVSKLVLISPYFELRGRWYYLGKPETHAQRLASLIPFVRKTKVGQINDPQGLKQYISYRHLPTASVSELAAIGRGAQAKAKGVTCPTLWIHSTGDVVADFDRIDAIKKILAFLNTSTQIDQDR